MGQVRGQAHSVRWGVIGEVREPLPRAGKALVDDAIKRTRERVRVMVALGESREAAREQALLQAMLLCRRPYR